MYIVYMIYKVNNFRNDTKLYTSYTAIKGSRYKG